MTEEIKAIGKKINKGLIVVYGPLILLVCISVFGSKYLAKELLGIPKQNYVIAVTFFGALVLGWIWWSYKVVKWKCEAFTDVGIETGIRLYRRAVEVGLIWRTGSIFNKTEIWSTRDKEKWSKIDREVQKIFEPNPGV